MATAGKKSTTKKKTATKSDGTASETAAAKTVKKTTRRRAASAEPPRAKLYWGVFNQNSKRVAVFDFADKKSAEAHVKKLSKDGAEHFLQRIKEAIE